MGMLVIWLMPLIISSLYLSRFLERRRAISLKWPTGISEKKLVRYCRLYLGANGWTLLEDWDWIYIYIRARKDKVELNLRVADVSTLSWETIFRDLNENSVRLRVSIGVISASPLPSWVAEAAELTGSFVMKPSDLSHAASLVAEAKLRYENVISRVISRTFSDPVPDRSATLVP